MVHLSLNCSKKFESMAKVQLVHNMHLGRPGLAHSYLYVIKAIILWVLQTPLTSSNTGVTVVATIFNYQS